MNLSCVISLGFLNLDFCKYGSGEEENQPAHKRRGRPQKPLTSETDDDIGKIEDEENMNVNDVVSNKEGKKRNRNKQAEEEGDLVKDESEWTQVNVFRLTPSRRKSKPRRAAESGVQCT
ncbi:hypothetical protein Hanom_Chr17g01571421 [Helianthus anomalus]